MHMRIGDQRDHDNHIVADDMGIGHYGRLRQFGNRLVTGWSGNVHVGMSLLIWESAGNRMFSYWSDNTSYVNLAF